MMAVSVLSYGWNCVGQVSKIQVSDMKFLRGVKRCTKLGNLRKNNVREELNFFNTNDRLKGRKRQWEEQL